MNLDPTWLFLSLIPSGVGLALFIYGKKQARWPQLVGGLALMVYPYFTDTVGWLVGAGLAIGVGIYAVLRAGW